MANGALLWDKSRSSVGSHYLLDSVRGISNTLSSDTTGAEASFPSWFTNFGTNTYTVGSSDWSTGITVVDWIWAANGSGSSNTSGSITSTVSANTTSGFSVVTWTGTGAASATIGHGLGVAPLMIITKERNFVDNWFVYTATTGNTQYMQLNTTNSASVYTPMWNSTTPTSSVFSTAYLCSNAITYVAYCFSEVSGYSKAFSYTGNGSTDGPFVFCGFRPAYVMIKRTDTSGEWILKDTTRSPYNADGLTLLANRSDAEYGSGNTEIDELSNGFKCRTTSASANASGGTYIGMAFASVPFKFSLAR